MNHIMDHIGIYVNENGNKAPYKRILYDKGIPNYIPTKPDEVFKDLQIDQLLFLPIEMDTFNTDRENFFVGYRYIFTTVSHCTVSLLKDPNLMGLSKLQMTLTVQRIRYSIKDDIDIIIDKVCDPLFPPRVFDLECPARDAHKQVMAITSQLINQLNGWYLEKNV